jgi:hypothetical protein
MKEGEELIEIKAYITKASYDKYIEETKAEDPYRQIWALIGHFFDVKECGIHKAKVITQKPLTFISVSGYGNTITSKDWEQDDEK